MTKIPLLLKGQTPAPEYGPWWTPRHVVFALGFRVFFLAATLFAAVAMPLWLAVLAGQAKAPPTFGPIVWHAHEMLFGYAVAVIAGFLLTAGAKWTGRTTATGGSLALLVVVWLAGRVAVGVPLGLPRAAVMATDLAFLPLLAIVLARPIVAARSTRNYPFVPLLLVMAGANLGLHLAAMESGALPARAVGVALDVVMMFMLVVGGRVIPQFTGNRLGCDVVHRPVIARIALGLALAVLVADVLGLSDWIGPLALAAGVATFARMAGWKTAKTLRVPMLWILHLGYAWVAVALLLRGASVYFPEVPVSSATHALTAGAIGSLTLGMMARVSLGHTGRLIVAARATTVGFALMGIAGVVRVFGGIAVPEATQSVIRSSGALWSLAMVLFLVVYTPILTRPRVDGLAG